jgi:nitrate/nitrite-specific signal transduction histidine kinase
MTLRLKLMVVTSAVVLSLFGISEWLSYRQTTALLEAHEAILVETADHTVALEKLKETRDTMFQRVTTVRAVNAFVTLIIAVAVLNYVWYRVIYRPIRRLLAQINIMGRGTWKSALPVHRNDEIGELTTAFNELGQQLTSTFHHINTSSKLSALALIGNRLVREINVARGEVLSAAQTLQAANQDPHTLSALLAMNAVEAKLGRLETQFQIDFDRDVVEASADSPPVRQ